MQKIIVLCFQFIENQWFVTRNIALACYPLALQTLSASLLNFVNLRKVLFIQKSRLRPIAFLLYAYLSGRYKNPTAPTVRGCAKF